MISTIVETVVWMNEWTDGGGRELILLEEFNVNVTGLTGFRRLVRGRQHVNVSEFTCQVQVHTLFLKFSHVFLLNGNDGTRLLWALWR